MVFKLILEIIIILDEICFDKNINKILIVKGITNCLPYTFPI